MNEKEKSNKLTNNTKYPIRRIISHPEISRSKTKKSNEDTEKSNS